MIVDCFYNCLIKNSNFDNVVAKIENNSVQILLTIKVTNILNFIKILNSMNDFVFKITGIYYKILSFKIGLKRTLCL